MKATIANKTTAEWHRGINVSTLSVRLSASHTCYSRCHCYTCILRLALTLLTGEEKRRDEQIEDRISRDHGEQAGHSEVAEGIQPAEGVIPRPATIKHEAQELQELNDLRVSPGRGGGRQGRASDQQSRREGHHDIGEMIGKDAAQDDKQQSSRSTYHVEQNQDHGDLAVLCHDEKRAEEAMFDLSRDFIPLNLRLSTKIL